MILTQSLDPRSLAGKVIEFSADIRFELGTPKQAHGLKTGGGLLLTARKNGRVVLNSIFDHEPNMGVHDWQSIRIVVEIPEEIDYLEVGFMHQAGGLIQVRNPAVRELTGTCELTLLGQP